MLVYHLWYLSSSQTELAICSIGTLGDNKEWVYSYCISIWVSRWTFRQASVDAPSLALRNGNSLKHDECLFWKNWCCSAGTAEDCKLRDPSVFGLDKVVNAVQLSVRGLSWCFIVFIPSMGFFDCLKFYVTGWLRRPMKRWNLWNLVGIVLWKHILRECLICEISFWAVFLIPFFTRIQKRKRTQWSIGFFQLYNLDSCILDVWLDMLWFMIL